jgi:Holliday junction DNA helicase RuvA
VIAYVRGTVRHLDEAVVVVDVGGIGYEVMLPGIEAKALKSRLFREGEGQPPEGQEAALWIYYHVAERQPKPLLIGFQQRQDREFFQLLLSVAEIGPTVAARSLTIPVCDYASAIERRDVRTLGSLPGIGKRKAEQLVASLKGKVLGYALLPPPEIEDTPEARVSDYIGDVEEALIALGYKRAEAVHMIEAARKRAPQAADFQALMEEIWRGRDA